MCIYDAERRPTNSFFCYHIAQRNRDLTKYVFFICILSIFVIHCISENSSFYDFFNSNIHSHNLY